MQLPTIPSGSQGLPQFCRDVVAYLRSLTPHSSPTVQVTHRGSGTTFKGTAKSTAASVSGVAAVNCPLDLTLTDAGTNYTATFYPGTANGLIPSNYATGITGIGYTATRYITCDLTFSDGEVQSAVMTADAAIPAGYPITEGLPPTTLSVLTHIIISGVVYRLIGCGSLTLTATEAFRTDKSGALSPGERPFVQWWTWAVTIT